MFDQINNVQVDERQRVLKAILLKRGFFTAEEISSYAGVTARTLLPILKSLEPYLESLNDDGSPYRVKAQFREVLRDEAGYPPRPSCEGGWSISK